MTSLLERRRIEAAFAAQLLEVFIEEMGRGPALALLAKAIIRAAEGAGEIFARETRADRTDLLAYAEILKLWQQDDALAVTMIHATDDRLEFDVTRCRYAEMYHELGLGDLGAILSCNRDGAFCHGFNTDITLRRTQTIMEGATHCDFRYSIKE